MAKAKRLLQSGQVHVLRNGFNYIVGHVIGDHGEYDTEISRDDPNGRAITGWQCSCPWDQYAWQRTRKWKKFEGRPCSHVMALYWKALATPMDEQLTPDQAAAIGTGQALPAPAVPEHPPEIEKDIMQGEKHQDHLPKSFGPEGDIIQGDQQQMNLPPDALGGPPGPAQAPMAPPPGQGPQGPQPPGILPPFPGEQMAMPWGGPGTTPGGGVSPPGAYTVPGAKPQTPANPIQNPSTYSKLAGQAETAEMWLRTLRNQYAEGKIAVEEYEQKVAEYRRYLDAMGVTVDWNRIHQSATFNAPQPVRAKKPLMGIAEGPVKGQYGDGEYREIPAGTAGEVYSVDDVGGQQWIECRFDLPESGEHEPFRVVVYVEPGDIEAAPGLKPSDPAIRRHTKVTASDWRSASPHVPESYRIDPEFGCLTHAENLVEMNPQLKYQEGWVRGSDGQEGSHAWAETPEGEIVDPYFEWKLPGQPRDYRRAEPHEDPFDRGRGWAES